MRRSEVEREELWKILRSVFRVAVLFLLGWSIASRFTRLDNKLSALEKLLKERPEQLDVSPVVVSPTQKKDQ